MIYSERDDRRFLESLSRAHGDVSFRDVTKMFKIAGYVLERVKGSHHVFVPAEGEGPPFVFPVHSGKVVAFYVRKAVGTLFPDV